MKVDESEHHTRSSGGRPPAKLGATLIHVRMPNFLVENIRQYQKESELETFSDALRELVAFGLIILRAKSHFLVSVEGMEGLAVFRPIEPQRGS